MCPPDFRPDARGLVTCDTTVPRQPVQCRELPGGIQIAAVLLRLRRAQTPRPPSMPPKRRPRCGSCGHPTPIRPDRPDRSTRPTPASACSRPDCPRAHRGGLHPRQVHRHHSDGRRCRQSHRHRRGGRPARAGAGRDAPDLRQCGWSVEAFVDIGRRPRVDGQQPRRPADPDVSRCPVTLVWPGTVGSSQNSPNVRTDFADAGYPVA